MKNLINKLCPFLIVLFSVVACSDDSSTPTPDPTPTDNPPTSIDSVWVEIGTDVSGDGKIQTGPSSFIDGMDGTKVEYLYSTTTDRLSFRITVVDLASFSTSPSVDFNFLLPNGTIPSRATGEPFRASIMTHRTASVYTDDGGTPPSSYTYSNTAQYAVNGIAFTDDVDNFNGASDLWTICQNCVDIHLDTSLNQITCSMDRAKIISDEEIGSSRSAKIRLSSNVGYQRGNNDLVVDNVEFTITLKDTSSTNDTPTVTTTSVSSITDTSAVSGGNISNQGTSSVTARGVCYSTSQNPTIIDFVTTNGSDTGSFIANLTGLKADSTYYVRAYATNASGTSYGNEISFTTTKTNTLPVVTTTSASSITDVSAISGGNVLNQGGSVVTSRGICYSTSSNPTLSDNVINSGNGTGSFVSNLSNLSSDTKYYIRSYATNTSGTAYGNEVSFTTAKTTTIPSVSTLNISSIQNTSAITGGNVTSDGNLAVTERGIIYGLNPNPTFSTGTALQNGTGTGSYSITITGLTENTTYYVRSYAINSSGIAFGNELNFTTTNVTQLATLTTIPISAITSNSANSGGNISYDGNASIVQRGVVYSTSPNPTVSNNFVISGSGDGSFTSALTGLTSNTTYFVRAFATNSAGTAYGNELSFTTNGPPSVNTINASLLSATSATIDIDITSDGGSTIIAAGVVYGLSPNPTTANSSVNLGSVTGQQTVTINNLLQKFTYYVRSYARNANGITYGAQLEVSTFVVGQSHQGGIIAYIDASGKHGFIASTSDQNSFIPWANTSIPLVLIGATGTFIGDGLMNTNMIVNSQGSSRNYAAKLCSDYSSGGYSDWFLPSKNELNQIYLNAAMIPNIAANSGYWSSSEDSVSEVWIQNLTNGVQSKVVKTNSNHVRAIRYF